MLPSKFNSQNKPSLFGTRMTLAPHYLIWDSYLWFCSMSLEHIFVAMVKASWLHIVLLFTNTQTKIKTLTFIYHWESAYGDIKKNNNEPYVQIWINRNKQMDQWMDVCWCDSLDCIWSRGIKTQDHKHTWGGVCVRHGKYLIWYIYHCDGQFPICSPDLSQFYSEET